MQLQNRSAFHRTDKMLPIVDFVASQTRFSDRATVRVLDVKDPTKLTGGLATKYRSDAALHPQVPPSLIQLNVSRWLTYPRTSLHVAEVGLIVLGSWEEEVLLVLAHEIAHIRQFWSGGFNDEHAAEVDAERFAKRTLTKWRRSRDTVGRRLAKSSSCKGPGPLPGSART